MKSVRWGRVLRLTGFALVMLYIFGNIGLAWVYVASLVDPGCAPRLPLPGGFPEPIIDTITTAGGHQVEVWVYPSQNGATIISLGGLGGSLGAYLPPADFLLEAGYGVVQVGSRACAQPKSLVTLGYREGEDVSFIMQDILHNDYVKAKKIGVYGFSMGGVAAIRAASLNPEIAAVVAEGGYYNLGKDFVADSYSPFDKVFLYTLAGTFWLRTGINPWDSSPIDDLPKISPRPVFLIYGEHEVEDGRGWQQFEAAAEPKEFWLVPGGDHGSNHIAAPEEYQQRILEFFDSALLADE